MFELLLLLIFLASGLTMYLIVRKKIPVLLDLPIKDPKPIIEKENAINNNLILQKILSKIRILVLKTDNKTSEWMKRLREKAKENKTKFSEDYWKKLRK